MAFDLNDKTSNNNDLTDINTVTEVTNDPPFTPNTSVGSFASASSERFDIQQNTVGALKQTGNFTIEAWIKTSGTDLAVVQIGTIFNPYSGIRLYVDNTGKVQLFSARNSGTTQGTDYQQVNSTAAVNGNVWTHIAGDYDASNIKTYVNGSADGSVAWTNNAAYAATSYSQISSQVEASTPTYGAYFNGSIDEVRLWSTNRGATNINNNKSIELVGNETNLVGYWPLNVIPSPTVATTGVDDFAYFL